MPRPAIWPLGLVFALAVAVRLSVFAVVSPDPAKFFTPDSVGYEQRALNLLRHGVFSGSSEPPYVPDVLRTPGYPAFLAGVYALAGPRPAAAVLLQILLGGVTAVLTADLARALRLPPRAALVAAGLVALEPVSAMIGNLLLTETLFSVLLVLALGCLARVCRASGAGWLAGAAVAFGLAALVRPIGQFLPLVLLPLLGFRVPPWSWRPVVRRGIPLVLGVALLLAPWAYRNYRETGILALSTIAPGVLFWSWAPVVLAQAHGTTVETERDHLADWARVQAREGGVELTGRVAGQRAEALRILRDHPRETLAMLGKGAGRLLLDPGYTLVCTLLDPANRAWACFSGQGVMNEPGMASRAWRRFLAMRPGQQGTLVASGLLLGGLYLGAGIGFSRLVRARRWLAAGLLGAAIGYFVVLSAAAQAESRFRVPVVPLLAVLAGLACVRPDPSPVSPRRGPPAGTP